MKTDSPIDPTAAGYRWAMLGAVWAVYYGFGLVAGSLAPVISLVIDDLGLTRASMGVVLGAWQLVYLGAAIPAGRVIDRIGLRWSLGLASLLIATSGLARAGATGWWTLFAAVAIFGLGGPLVSVGAPKLIANWFNDHDRRTAVGVYTTAPALGTATALATTNSVLLPALGSWRFSVAALSLVTASTGLVWLAVAGRAPWTEPRIVAGGPRHSTLALLRLPIVRTVLVIATGTFLFSHAMANWLVEVLRENGVSPAQAGGWAALVTVTGIVAGATIPRFASPKRRVPILMTVLILAAAGALVLRTAPSAALLIPALMAIGLARAATPIDMLALMDDPDVGPDRMAPAGGLFFTAGEIGGVLGPLLTGVLAQTSGGFQLPITVLAGVAFAMALVATRLRPIQA
ncbi:MAG: MFS transporter [Acidimicrobiales bacterium]